MEAYRYFFIASEAWAGSSEMVMVKRISLAAPNSSHQATKASPVARSSPMSLYRLSMNTWVMSEIPGMQAADEALQQGDVCDVIFLRVDETDAVVNVIGQFLAKFHTNYAAGLALDSLVDIF